MHAAWDSGIHIMPSWAPPGLDSGLLGASWFGFWPPGRLLGWILASWAPPGLDSGLN